MRVVAGSFIAVVLAVMLTSCSGPGKQAEKLTPAQIFEKCRAAYAGLSSYSDDGEVVAKLSGLDLKTTFTIRLARPNYYRIAWEQSGFGGMVAGKQAVWSSGQGDYLQMRGKPEKQPDMQSALAGATGISGGSAATVPALFLHLNWGDPLLLTSDTRQKEDAKVDEVDCYTFERELQGNQTTLWIGKSDFLLHQVQQKMSMNGLNDAMEMAAKTNPSLKMPANMVASDMTSVETHRHIVLNKALKPADFEK